MKFLFTDRQTNGQKIPEKKYKIDPHIRYQTSMFNNSRKNHVSPRT